MEAKIIILKNNIIKIILNNFYIKFFEFLIKLQKGFSNFWEVNPNSP